MCVLYLCVLVVYGVYVWVGGARGWMWVCGSFLGVCMCMSVCILSLCVFMCVCAHEHCATDDFQRGSEGHWSAWIRLHQCQMD